MIWGRRRKRRPKEYFVFGTIQEEDRIIRINPLLDQPFVPLWFLQYVLYHEMLHSVVPDEIGPDGRRRVHTEEFNRREREFPELSSRPPLGRRKSRAIPALDPVDLSPLRSLVSRIQTARVSLLRSF